MTDGEKLFVTVNYGFNYDESHFEHLFQFDILTQFFEHRNNLEGFVSDEDGDRIEDYSEVALLVDDIHKAFDNRDIPGIVIKYLHDFEMYEILAEYNAPLSPQGLKYRDELLTENNKYE